MYTAASAGRNLRAVVTGGSGGIGSAVVSTDAFGVKALQKFSTTFVAFEPRPFLEMTRLTWVQGDPAYALRRLDDVIGVMGGQAVVGPAGHPQEAPGTDEQRPAIPVCR